MCTMSCESTQTKPTGVIADDTDIFQLLIHHTDLSDYYENMYMKTSRQTDITEKKSIDPALIYGLLYLNVLSGCDTTSSPCGIKFRVLISQKVVNIGKQLQQKLFFDFLEFINIHNDQKVPKPEFFSWSLYSLALQLSPEFLRLRTFSGHFGYNTEFINAKIASVSICSTPNHKRPGLNGKTTAPVKYPLKCLNQKHQHNS